MNETIKNSLDELKREIALMTSLPIKKKSRVEDLIKNVKTLEDVYFELGIEIPTIDNFLFLREEKRENALYTQYQKDINELFNNGWIPDFSNSSQKKYIPYFVRSGSGWVLGSVFYYDGVSYDGSCFYYEKEEIAKYCATQFINVYSKIL